MSERECTYSKNEAAVGASAPTKEPVPRASNDTKVVGSTKAVVSVSVAPDSAIKP